MVPVWVIRGLIPGLQGIYGSFFHTLESYVFCRFAALLSERVSLESSLAGRLRLEGFPLRLPD